MPTHTETRELPYTPDQMFDLVSDIARYPEFLPWCSKARIIRREGDAILAELTIGYKLFREKFTSRVNLDREKHTINVAYVSGPMKYLRNEWQFHKLPKKSTRVDFFVHFEFSNPILSGLMNMFFDVAFRQMVSAFEKRAEEIYSPLKAL
jgi:coenzyme Q-binding protein COQ10